MTLGLSRGGENRFCRIQHHLSVLLQKIKNEFVKYKDSTCRSSSTSKEMSQKMLIKLL